MDYLGYKSNDFKSLMHDAWCLENQPYDVLLYDDLIIHQQTPRIYSKEEPRNLEPFRFDSAQYPESLESFKREALNPSLRGGTTKQEREALNPSLRGGTTKQEREALNPLLRGGTTKQEREALNP